MAGIVTNSVRKSHATDGHRVVAVLLDGEEITHEFFDETFDALDWNEPLPSEIQRLSAKQIWAFLGLKKLRLSGVPIENFTGRVANGEEATNVKQYQLISKDITKTNIGTSYVNIPVGANGERSLVDFTGCTQYRIIMHANLVGIGPFGFRLVRDSDNAVLYENAAVALTGERELDTDWQTLPAAAVGMFLVRLQAKSIVATDDPTIRRCVLGVR